MYLNCLIDTASYDMSIAGILTDFDPLIHDYSNVYYYTDEERFEVLFDKVSIYKKEINFTFSVALFSNGLVQVTYHDIPPFEDILNILPNHLIYNRGNVKYPFYYSGIIGKYGKTTPQTYARDETSRDYDIRAHKQVELTPINSFKSNNTILFCPMSEVLCITPYFIDTFGINIIIYYLYK